MNADDDQAEALDQQAEQQEKTVRACKGRYDYNTCVHSRKEFDRYAHELELASWPQRQTQVLPRHLLVLVPLRFVRFQSKWAATPSLPVIPVLSKKTMNIWHDPFASASS